MLKRYWLAGGLGVCGAAVILFASQKYGIGLAPDSVGYIQVARGVAAGQGIPPGFTLQPPLYPLALALGGIVTRGDPLDAAMWLNALWFAGVILCAGILLLRHLPDFPPLALLATVSVLLARPLVNVALTAYSEMLFILLTLAAFLALELYFERSDWRWLGAATLATALACLTRYVGVAVLAACALSILWHLRSEPGRAALSAVTFSVLSAVPPGLWVLRNLLVSGEPFGERAASRVTLLENVNLTAETFVNWFVPNAYEWAFWLGLVALVGISAILVVTRRAPPAPRRAVSSAPYVLFVALFLALMLVTATTTAYNRINTRLLSPLFLPALLLLMLFLDGAANPLRVRAGARVVNGGVLALTALLLLFPIQTNLPRLARAAEQGAGGYNTTRWRTNATLAYVRVHRADFTGTIYSNGPDALYILAHVDAQSILPKFQYASNERAYDAAALRGSYPPEPATLVWLENIEREDFLFSLEELNDFTKLSLLARFDDGAVYRIEKR